MFPRPLKSPELWQLVLTIAAVAGIGCMIAGLFLENETLTHIGVWLMVPLLAGGVFLILVIIPILMWANRKR